MSRERLDLLLLSDEIAHDSSGTRISPRRNYVMQFFAEAYRQVEITEAQAEAIVQRYGVHDYLFRMADERIGISVPHRPSLALADLATVARAGGYTVRVIDNFLRWPSRFERVRAICRDTPPLLIGLSTTFMFDPQIVREIVALLRELAPESRIALGGPTVRRIEQLHGCADFAVFGSGEEPLIGLLQALRGTRPVETVPRIARRCGEGAHYGPQAADAALVGTRGEPYRALKGERLPVPDWSLYPRAREQVYPIEFSRGCKYNCYYCSYDRGKNVRSLEDIRDELLRNAARGIRKYRFSDSNFTDGPPSYPRYPHDVCQTIIDLDLNLEWSCYARVDDVTEELASLMRRAGCFALFFGVESGDDAILRLMRKGHDAADAERGIRIAQQAGIRAHTNFVVGYPGETQATNARTLDFIERVRPDTVGLSQFWAEEKTPVMGPRMRELRLVGEGAKWAHATMDSDRATELLQGSLRQLLRAGITIGSEYEIAGLMCFGLSLEEALQHHHDVSRLQPDATASAAERAQALARIGELMRERFPRAIAEDYRAMCAA